MDDCPDCGAEKIPMVEGNSFVKYRCGTQPGHRTHKCKDREIAWLKAMQELINILENPDESQV